MFTYNGIPTGVIMLTYIMQRYYDERQGALGRNGLGTRLNDKMGGGGGQCPHWTGRREHTTEKDFCHAYWPECMLPLNLYNTPDLVVGATPWQYSGTSDKGPSEIGTTSLQRTLVAAPC